MRLAPAVGPGIGRNRGRVPVGLERVEGLFDRAETAERTYVVENEFWVTIPSIIAAIVSFGLALYLLYRNGADVRPGLLMTVPIALVSVAIQLAAGWTVLGLSNALYLGPSVPVSTLDQQAAACDRSCSDSLNGAPKETPMRMLSFS